MTTTITFVLYIGLVALISLWAYRRTLRSEDYFLGGRQLSAPTAALSAGASDMSGWLLLGLPGYAFSSGLEALWLAGGLCLGLAVCWLSVARRLRVYSEFLDNALTIPVYLQRRFNDKTPLLRLTTAFFILLFFLFYVSSGFVAGGKLFSAVFGSSYLAGVWLTFFFVVIYTFVGGFLAVSWTDVLQGLLMLLALLIAPVMVMVANGGIDNSVKALATINPHLLNPLNSAAGKPLTLATIVSSLAWGLGYFGQPHILARFKAIKDKRQVGSAVTVAIGWSLLVNIGAISVGLLAVVAFAEGQHAVNDSEQVFILLANTLFHPVIAGVLMAAILAAIMSTADSQLLVCSSVIAEDVMGLLRAAGPREKPLLSGRIGVLLLGLLALLFALDSESKVLDVVSYAWAGLGAAFGPVILFSLYLRNMDRYAALAGIVTGGLTVIAWKNLSGGWFDVYELAPGFMLSTLAIVLVAHFNAMERSPERMQFSSFSDDLKRRH